MILKKKGCPLPKINMQTAVWRRECGRVEWCVGLFFMLFWAIVACCQLQVAVYQTSAGYLEDALAASNLASAVIDLEEYGRTQEVLLKNPQLAYEKFCNAVKGNLHLNDAWECENKCLIADNVSVAEYIVYNVQKDIVTVSEVSFNGEVFQWQGTLGTVVAPNGVEVEATGIYSEITYTVEGFGGVVTEARKGKLVDIVVTETQD